MPTLNENAEFRQGGQPLRDHLQGSARHSRGNA